MANADLPSILGLEKRNANRPRPIGALPDNLSCRELALISAMSARLINSLQNGARHPMCAARATTTPIDGVCDPRFAPVREAFVTNFAERDEVGAAIALSVGGRMVVDLWGGWADRARAKPWRSNTLVNFFSVGKAFTATCALLLVQRGLLDLDSPVTRWWPQFAAEGKSEITLRQILSHRAGLPALRAPLEDGAMLDWTRMVQALEAQAPWWEPGTDHGYQVNTFGYLVGEPVRRASGVSLGTLLREEIAGPLGADVHIGLPASEHGRVAEFLWPERAQTGTGGEGASPPGPLTDDELMKRNAHSNPPGLSGGGWVNTAPWRLAEIPSTNGHGTARGVAQIYQGLLGRRGQRPILEPAMLAEAISEHAYGQDRVLDRPSRFGLGYQLTHVERPLGPNLRPFGHFGLGGTLGFCDPDAEVAFGYLGNHMGARWQNPRNRALIDAIYASL
jgi:CubicO group peptidase (beta-lactamase class C family)